PREARLSAMVLTVTEDTPADMLAGSMELLVQIPRDHHVQTQRVTVQRSTPMMDLLVQIATAHKLTASSYTLQAIGERGLVLPHQPNTPIGALDALQVKLLPKQGTFLARKNRQSNQPFETTFRLQVHLPRNQLYVSRVSPKTNLGEILSEVCREKNLDRNKYELRHPANQSEKLDLTLTLQDYALQEVTLCQLQRSNTNSTVQLSRSHSNSGGDDIIMSQIHDHHHHHHHLQNQQQNQKESKHRSHHKSSGGVFSFVFGRHKSKESSVSSESSLGNRSVSPTRSDETARSTSPPPPASRGRPNHQNQYQQQHSVVGSMQPPSQVIQQQQQQPPKPTRKRRPAPKPPTQQQQQQQQSVECTQTTTSSSRSKSESESHAIISAMSSSASDKDKIVISHSRNSSDSSGYHEASVLSDNPDNSGTSGSRIPETLPRIKSRMQGILETPRKLAQTSQASKSLSNLAMTGPGHLAGSGATLTRGISNTSLSSTGQRKKRAAPAPPMARPLPSAISVQGLERIVDSDESLTSDMDLSKPSSDIEATLGSSSSQASSDIAACHPRPTTTTTTTTTAQPPQHQAPAVEPARVVHAKGSKATDTDILLQKVSDTLSNALTPPSPPPTPVDEQTDTAIGGAHQQQQQIHSAQDPSSNNNVLNQSEVNSETATVIDRAGNNDKHQNRPDDSTLVAQAVSNDGTLSSQQDTSDYVSNSGGEEQLSIADWEYQIPAPPSAFRDDCGSSSCNSIPSLSDKSSVVKSTIATEPTIKGSISTEGKIHERSEIVKPANITKATIELQKQANPVPKSTGSKPLPPATKENSSQDSVDHCSAPSTQSTSTISRHKSIEEESELKKEVINELESKINLASTKLDQSAPAKEKLSTPAKIAPVENNLSNFTITTYGRQKSLQDIFEPMEQQSSGRLAVGSFATLGRGKSLASTTDLMSKNGMGGLKSAQSMERVNALSSLGNHSRSKFGVRDESAKERTVVHRSKSYITLASNEKFQNRINDIERSKDDDRSEIRPCFDITDSSRRTTSVVNLNSNPNDDIPRHKEKFSQWRDNILRKQEDPSPEKQLQSLQVLKSILPQLKSAQATAENGYKTGAEKFFTSKGQDIELEKVRESSPASMTSEVVKLRSVNRSNQHEPSKRYTYCGPPSVSLGSWSERPSLNVQIKNDMDYKLSSKSGNTSGSRTVVSLNSNERLQEPTNQLTASDDNKRDVSREVKKDDEPSVDTSSVSFKELTKAFGQANVRMRPKPVLGPRPNVLHRHSEYLDRPKQSGFSDLQSSTTSTSCGVNQKQILNGSTPSIKRYTSVVGINNNINSSSNNSNNGISNNANKVEAGFRFSNPKNDVNDQYSNNNVNNVAQHTNFRFANGQPKVPTVPKSFSSGQKDREPVVPRPPTMPIITGVTLKSVSARSKSNPLLIQQDPRDQLLESIRNFGGRDRLKKAIERH
ncbi:hypothetical protein QAD02_023756, partial [Eretmocerus hayati]